MERKISEMEEELKVTLKFLQHSKIKLTKIVLHEKLTQNSPHSRLEKREKQENSPLTEKPRDILTCFSFRVGVHSINVKLLQTLSSKNDRKFMKNAQFIEVFSFKHFFEKYFMLSNDCDTDWKKS